MTLTDDDIRAFARIWREEFGEDLTPEKAREEATLLMEVYLLLAEPDDGEAQDDDPSVTS